MNNRRIQKDFQELLYSLRNNTNVYFMNDLNNPLENISFLNNFTIILKGPSNTPYDDGKFKLHIVVPNDYPFKPPSIKMLTPIFHPNIKDKEICLDILKDNWKPSYNLLKILESLYDLLKNPNSNNPLSADVNNIYMNNKEKFIEQAKEWTLLYAQN